MMFDVSALDLPQPFQKPSFSTLVATLQSLELSPPIWNHRRRRSEILAEQESLASHRKAEFTRYISTIIKSPLSWIEDDEQKEVIWTLASKRMSERCGRTAMGELVRKWPFDRLDDTGSYETFELAIKEPALTGDLLGFKTWGSSYVLARYLPKLRMTSLTHLFDKTSNQEAPAVVELGSGTGLSGLAAAALWKVHVSMSDLPNIMDNLRSNVERNRALIEEMGGGLSVGPLTWGGNEGEFDQKLFGRHHQFKIVMAADPLYDDDHPALLASAIGQQLALGAESRAVVMIPQRDDATMRLLQAFKQAMLDLDGSIACVEENVLVGQDDWVEDTEAGTLRCWLGIFSRGKL